MAVGQGINTGNASYRGLTAVLCGVVSLLGGLLLLRTRQSGASSWEKHHPLRLARSEPISIPPITSACFPVGEADHRWLDTVITPTTRAEISPSFALHVLRANGLGAEFAHEEFPTSNSLLTPLLNDELGKDVFGGNTMAVVNTGARYLSRTRELGAPRWEEFHRDQNLAAFAELGLPLETQIVVQGKTHRLSDVLQDSIANYFVGQKELEWTALAYSLYLPPHQSWVNRYGEEASFDSLANEMLERRIHTSSCSGTHLFYTLTVMYRVDTEHQILTPRNRERIRARLQRVAKLALDTQQPDGSWRPDWYFDSEFDDRNSDEQQSPADTGSARLLVTGHFSEWMLYLPEELQVPKSALRASCLWLLKHLKDQESADVADQICPCTHGVCVLKRLSIPRVN